MLKDLSIQNYALIDKVKVNLTEGLTMITGETGAGKSILLGALGLIAGNRADTQSLMDKSKKCIVEATFLIKDYSLQDFFETHDLDYEHASTIRREISSNGKSRAFINDTPVTLNQLKELAERLIDIHSQHQTLTLNGNEFQLSVVDIFAQHAKTLADYSINYKTFKVLDKKLEELLKSESQLKKEQDYIQFQYDELETANLKAGEQTTMEQELETLNNVEEIKSTLNKANNGLGGNEQNIVSSLNEVKNMLAAFEKFNPEIRDLSERIKSSYIELKDISNELENLEQSITYDPQRIEELTDRLDIIFRLQQKHQVQTVEELIVIMEELSDKLQAFNSLEGEIVKTKKELELSQGSLILLAKKIAEKRKKVIPKIEKEVATLLSSLSMPDAQLKINHLEGDLLTPRGTDKVHFLFSANKGSDFKDLNKVASGGELSRLMLSVKSLLAKLTALPTIIFDEIDTGVSGDVADKVGSIMKLMAENMQVITITHLPQIASKGNAHLLVFKEEVNNKTITNIRKIEKEERIQEIAKMLSTGDPTTSSIKNAKEFLKVGKSN